MTPPTVYHLRNADGIEVFTGTISPAPGGGSSPFTPSDVNSQIGQDWNPLVLSLWLDPSDAATIHEADNPGFVSTLDDKSGNGNDAVQAIAANQPTTGALTIGGLNAIGYDGAVTNLVAPLVRDVSVAPWLAFLVFKPGAVDLDIFNYGIVSETGAGTELKLNNSAATPELQTPNGVNLSIDPAAAQVVAYGGTGTLELLRLGNTLGSDANGPSLTSDIVIGAGDPGPPATDVFLGAIGELFVVTGMLNPDQMQGLVSYLATKWGITL